MNVVLDCNIYDKLADDEGLVRVMQEKAASGQLVVIATRRLWDEICNSPHRDLALSLNPTHFGESVMFADGCVAFTPEITMRAPDKASSAITAATAKSGQLLLVPKTPTAASITATLPIASFRLQIHTERILASPSRCAESMSATPPFTSNARNATTPIVNGSGTAPLTKVNTVLAMTNTPYPVIVKPFTKAARKRQSRPIERTAREIP